MTGAESPRRPIRSFVKREGRMTEAQRHALDNLWPRYGVAAGNDSLDFESLFGRRAPVHLEIGFGNGEVLAAMAAAHPQQDYLGIEVHRPGVGALLRRLESDNIRNVRVLTGDASEALEQRIPDESLSAVYLFFPDPWPKKRHHKRRLVQPEFVERLQRKLLPGGLFHLATDWEDYARHMLAVLTQAGEFENVAGAGQFTARMPLRPLTRFERRGQRLGHGVWDLLFRRRQRQRPVPPSDQVRHQD